MYNILKLYPQGICIIFLYTGDFVQRVLLATENYPKKTGFFKEQNAGFSAQIQQILIKEDDETILLYSSYNQAHFS